MRWSIRAPFVPPTAALLLDGVRPLNTTLIRNERAWQGVVLDTAANTGWLRAHVRPAQTSQGWRTPVEGDAKGFSDVLLLRPPRQVVAELKMPGKKPTAEQVRWLDYFAGVPGVEVFLWDPRDWVEVVTTLR
jgi:hypothetical protein